MTWVMDRMSQCARHNIILNMLILGHVILVGNDVITCVRMMRLGSDVITVSYKYIIQECSIV